MITVIPREGRTAAPIILNIDDRIYYTLSVEEADKLSIQIANAIIGLYGQPKTFEPYDAFEPIPDDF